MEHDQFFQEVKLMVSDYLSARIRLSNMTFMKRALNYQRRFSSMVIAMLASMMLLFLSLALGFYLGSVFDSYGTGFLVVTGITWRCCCLFILLRKSWIEKLSSTELLSS